MQRADFYATYGPLAQKWSQESGIPAATILAIMASESNWGEAPSLFGIKGSGTGGTAALATKEDYGNGQVPVTDNFAVNNTPDDAFQQFYNLISTTPRYADAWKSFQQSGDANQLISDLQKSGYATAKSWPDLISNLSQQIQDEAPVTDTTASTEAAPKGPAGLLQSILDKATAQIGLTPDELAQVAHLAAGGQGKTKDQIAQQLYGKNYADLTTIGQKADVNDAYDNQPTIRTWSLSDIADKVKSGDLTPQQGSLLHQILHGATTDPNVLMDEQKQILALKPTPKYSPSQAISLYQDNLISLADAQKYINEGIDDPALRQQALDQLTGNDQDAKAAQFDQDMQDATSQLQAFQQKNPNVRVTYLQTSPGATPQVRVEDPTNGNVWQMAYSSDQGRWLSGPVTIDTSVLASGITAKGGGLGMGVDPNEMANAAVEGVYNSGGLADLMKSQGIPVDLNTLGAFSGSGFSYNKDETRAKNEAVLGETSKLYIDPSRMKDANNTPYQQAQGMFSRQNNLPVMNQTERNLYDAFGASIFNPKLAGTNNTEYGGYGLQTQDAFGNQVDVPQVAGVPAGSTDPTQGQRVAQAVQNGAAAGNQATLDSMSEPDRQALGNAINEANAGGPFYDGISPDEYALRNKLASYALALMSRGYNGTNLTPSPIGYAKGGTFMAGEPIIGFGLLSQLPRFIVGEAGKDERLTITPTDKDIRLGRESPMMAGVRRFATGGTVIGSTTNPYQTAVQQPNPQGPSGGDQAIQQNLTTQAAIDQARQQQQQQDAVAQALGAPTSADMAQAQQDAAAAQREQAANSTKAEQRAEASYARSEAARTTQLGQMPAEEQYLQNLYNTNTGYLNYQQGQNQQAQADLTQQDAAQRSLLDLVASQNAARAGEHTQMVGAEGDIQNQIDVARQQNARNAGDYRFGLAGLRTPTEILHSLAGGDPTNLPPGVRYALETDAQRLSRQFAQNEEERGLALAQQQDVVNSQLQTLQTKASQRSLNLQEQQNLRDLQLQQLQLEEQQRALAVTKAGLGGSTSSGSSGSGAPSSGGGSTPPTTTGGGTTTNNPPVGTQPVGQPILAGAGSGGSSRTNTRGFGTR